MENIKAYEKNGFIYFKVNAAKEIGPSSTGKSIIVAKNKGRFQKLEGMEGYSFMLIVTKSENKKDKKPKSRHSDDEPPRIIKSKAKPVAKKAIIKKRK